MVFAISEREALKLGLRIFTPNSGEICRDNNDKPITQGSQTSCPDWIYNDNNKLYYLDDVFTGITLTPEIKVSKIA